MPCQYFDGITFILKFHFVRFVAFVVPLNNSTRVVHLAAGPFCKHLSSDVIKLLPRHTWQSTNYFLMNCRLENTYCTSIFSNQGICLSGLLFPFVVFGITRNRCKASPRKILDHHWLIRKNACSDWLSIVALLFEESHGRFSLVIGRILQSATRHSFV